MSEKCYIVYWVCGLVTCFDEKFRVQWTRSENDELVKQQKKNIMCKIITPEELDKLCGYHKVVFEPNTLSRLH